jgi:hypothetical protein
VYENKGKQYCRKKERSDSEATKTKGKEYCKKMNEVKRSDKNKGKRIL